MATLQRRRMRLGELLVAAGVLDEARLAAALGEQRKWGGKLGAILVELGFVTETLMVKALSRQLGLPLMDLEKEPVESEVTRLLDVDVCERYGVFPILSDEERGVVRVATSDPTNYQALDAVAFRTNLKVEPVIATATGIDRAIRQHYHGEDVSDEVDASGLQRITRGGGVGEDVEGADHAAPPAQAASRPRDSLPEEVERVERALRHQTAALRGLVELLIERGVIDRDSYNEKLRSIEK